jgi:hypothetical protein
MTHDVDPAQTCVPDAGRVMCADSLGRTLLAMAVPPEHRRDGILTRVPVPGRRGELPESVRRLVLAAEAVDEAVPEDQVAHLDAEAVARWIAGHHRAETYPAVVLGSPHGAAVHLAVACGAAWLPTSFAVTVPWTGGSPGDWAAARDRGSRLAARILARNPGVSVRQVHDPVLRGALCGVTVTLHIQWRTLPAAYLELLGSRLAPGGAAVLVRDLRTWPVLAGPAGFSFQVGTPTSGWSAADHTLDNHAFGRLLRGIGAGDWPDPPADRTRRYAETSGDPALDTQLREIVAATGSAGHRMLYTDPQAFSAGVADLYRAWLRPAGGGRDALVGTGRMIDPWHAADSGVVPYWCESSSRAVADAAELWLAGSPSFDRISVLPEPPGTLHEETAALGHWRSVAAFALRSGTVDKFLASRYPLLPTAPGHASRALAPSADHRRPQPMPISEAVRHMAGNGSVPGLLVV